MPLAQIFDIEFQAKVTRQTSSVPRGMKDDSIIWPPQIPAEQIPAEESPGVAPQPSSAGESTLESPSGLRDVRIPFGQPVALHFDSFDDFISEVATNISVGGMLIENVDLRPPGTVFDFEFLLGGEITLIEGRAEVVWVRSHADEEGRPPGMGVRFLELGESSRSYIRRMVDAYLESGRSPFDVESNGPLEDKIGTVTTSEMKVWKRDEKGPSIWGVAEDRTATTRGATDLEAPSQEIRLSPPERECQEGRDVEADDRLEEAEAALRKAEDEDRERAALAAAEANEQSAAEIDAMRARLEVAEATTEKLTDSLDRARLRHAVAEENAGELSGRLDRARAELAESKERSAAKIEAMRARLEAALQNAEELSHSLEQACAENALQGEPTGHSIELDRMPGELEEATPERREPQ